MSRGILEYEKRLAVAAMAVLLIVLFFALICVGRYPISPLRAFEIIGKAVFGNREGMDIYESSVILSIRLPRILSGDFSWSRSFCFWRGLPGDFWKSACKPGHSWGFIRSRFWRVPGSFAVRRYGGDPGNRPFVWASGCGGCTESVAD